MSETLNNPAPPGAGMSLDDHVGALVLIDVLGIETKINTSFGEADAVRADVYVIDGAGSPKEYIDTLIFPRVLQGQLKRSMGQKVIGRIGKGVAKPGQSPPWILTDASAADIQAGEAFLARSASASVQSPAPPF